jgi:Protein of unknown function (DUF3631)
VVSPAAIDGAALAEGAETLTAVEDFLRRFVVYPSVHALVAHVLWIAHTWMLDLWDSTPRIAFLSPEPGSGKTRALEATEPVVPNPVHAINTSPAFLFRRVSDPSGPPTILYDEIDTVFGPRAKDNEDTRAMLNAGHRRGAVAGRCVVRGQVVTTEELPAYAAVALAGLYDLPDTLHSRSIIVRMQPRTAVDRVEPWRNRLHVPEAAWIAIALGEWTDTLRAQAADGMVWPTMPPGVEDRAADLWEPLLYLADRAGFEWAGRARAAAVALVTEANNQRPSLGVRLLADLRSVFATRYFGETAVFTTDLLRALHAMEEAPWGDLHGKPLDARGLARRLGQYRAGPDNAPIAPVNLRIGTQQAKGYRRADLAELWSRYLPRGSSQESVPAVPSVPARSESRTDSHGRVGCGALEDGCRPTSSRSGDGWDRTTRRRVGGPAVVTETTDDYPLELLRFRLRPGRLYAEPAHPSEVGPGVYVADLDEARLVHELSSMPGDDSGERIAVDIQELVLGSPVQPCHFTLGEWVRIVSAHRLYWMAMEDAAE